MKRKKLWITLACTVLGIFVLCLGVHFLTRLTTVSVDFRTRLVDETRLETGILDKVKKDGEFNYKKSVLFTNTKESVEKIEKANPYIKVDQVIRKFPNKICVYVLERIPKYRMESSSSAGQWYILDDEFKVLEIVSESELDTNNFRSNTVEIKYLKATKTSVGDFINSNTELTKLNDITAGVYGKTEEFFAVMSIDFNTETNTFALTMRATDLDYNGGCVIKLVGLNDLKNKAFKATSAYVDKSFENINLNEKVIIISDDEGCKLG